MGELPSSATPQVRGLDIEAVEWLPSGADSGLVRVRGRWTAEDARRPGLPELGLRAGALEHRFESLPDARFARDRDAWRGSYLVASELLAGEPADLWVQWDDGTRAGLPPLDRGLAPPAEATPEPLEDESAGGQVFDAAVLAERRARRAEAAGLQQARKAAEALQALQALELRSAELERRLAEADAEHDAARSDLERRLAGERAVYAEIHEELTQRLEAAGEARARAEAATSAAEATLAAESAARVALEDELDRERVARAAADAALATARSEAEAQGGALLGQIAELDRRAAGLADAVRLEQAARRQAEAAAAQVRRPEAESGQMVAALAAAAAALREVPPAPAAPEAASQATPEAAPAGAEVEAAPEVVAPVTPEAAPPAPESERARPTIVSPPAQPARAHVSGRSRRDYPPLRGAVVKLAHDDPVTAGRLLAGLLPAQGLIVDQALDYDLTIREVGTFSVEIAGRRCFVNALEKPRSRSVTDFHLSADALVLAELLAGVHHRIGRFTGAVRYTGRRRRVRALKALSGAPLTLAEAVRGGARLEPELAYRALAYAVHPTWTKGRGFTIAQVISGPRPETWFLTARDGAGLSVAASPPPEAPAATVTMTRDAFDRLLRGEPVPRGRRPAVRGDHLAVALMKSWTDRAQGLAVRTED